MVHFFSGLWWVLSRIEAQRWRRVSSGIFFFTLFILTPILVFIIFVVIFLIRAITVHWIAFLATIQSDVWFQPLFFHNVSGFVLSIRDFFLNLFGMNHWTVVFIFDLFNHLFYLFINLIVFSFSFFVIIFIIFVILVFVIRGFTLLLDRLFLSHPKEQLSEQGHCLEVRDLLCVDVFCNWFKQCPLLLIIRDLLRFRALLILLIVFPGLLQNLVDLVPLLLGILQLAVSLDKHDDVLSRAPVFRRLWSVAVVRRCVVLGQNFVHDGRGLVDRVLLVVLRIVWADLVMHLGPILQNCFHRCRWHCTYSLARFWYIISGTYWVCTCTILYHLKECSINVAQICTYASNIANVNLKQKRFYSIGPRTSEMAFSSLALFRSLTLWTSRVARLRLGCFPDLRLWKLNEEYLLCFVSNFSKINHPVSSKYFQIRLNEAKD